MGGTKRLGLHKGAFQKKSTHTKTNYTAPKKHFMAWRKALWFVNDKMLNVQIKGMFPKKEYRSELIIDCNGKIERECCLVHEDMKEQKSYFSFAWGIVVKVSFIID